MDGWVVDGSATLAPAAHTAMRPVRLGEHLATGEPSHEGQARPRAEADVVSSRLQSLRAPVRLQGWKPRDHWIEDGEVIECLALLSSARRAAWS